LALRARNPEGHLVARVAGSPHGVAHDRGELPRDPAAIVAFDTVRAGREAGAAVCERAQATRERGGDRGDVAWRHELAGVVALDQIRERAGRSEHQARPAEPHQLEDLRGVDALGSGNVVE
jgi:hypothetical protein